MKDVGVALGVKSISNLVLKEIRGVYEKKELTKEETKCYKMTEREIYKKFDSLNEDELNIKGNKNVFVKNNVMTNIIKRCRGEKKRGIRAIDGFRKKFMTPDNEISVCPEHEVKSIIGTIFVNVDILEGYSVKIYEIDPYFCEHYNKKIQSDKVIKMDVHTYYLELMFSSRN